jgi:hypothetical protein
VRRRVERKGEHVQEPDNFGAGFTATKGNDMAPDAIVKKCTLLFVRLTEVSMNDTSIRSLMTHRRENAGNELASCDRQSKVDDHRPASTTHTMK